MGRQAFPIIGGIIGAVVAGIVSDGSATAQGYEAGFAIGAALGGIAGSYIDPIVIQGNRIGDTQLQVAAEGGARAMMFGRACVSATCVVARGNRKVNKVKSSNGKGSSGSTENQTVTWTFAIGLGEAIVGARVTRIWQDENLVYDVLPDGAISDDDNVSFGKKFKFYDGSETQLPDSDLQVFLDDCPYFRGTAYCVFPNFDLTATAERVPLFKFEIVNGVSLDVDEMQTLEWHFPNTQDSFTYTNSVTLHGQPDITYNVDLFLTGQMETRLYTTLEHRLGGTGRFITAADHDGGVWYGYNIYSIQIDKPPQTYYVNSFLPGETSPLVFTMDGTDTWKLTVSVAGDATITYFADTIDGLWLGSTQFGTTQVEIHSQQQIGAVTIPLSTLVTQLLVRSGMTTDQFDVSQLTDAVAGLCIESTVNGNDAVNAVVAPYFADPTEINGVLTWVKRGKDVLRTLTVDDLTEEPDIATRENVIEYPAKLSFYYQSPLTGYATTKATSYRYSEQVDSSGEGSVTAPITYYTSDEPAQVAQKLHKVMWTEADGSFQWIVGLHCIDLVPTDVVGLYLRGIATRARIIAIENDGTSLTLSLIKDRQSSYTSNVTTIPLPAPTAPQSATMSKAVLGVLDIPALQDTDDQLCYYTAMSGSTATWNGGQLQRSLDSGGSWSNIGDVKTDVTMGKLTVGITAASQEYTDTTNTVTVQLFDPANELVAFSDTTFLQEQGAIAIVADDGTWEVMQYRDAEDGGAGLWTLSHLQRGRLNTLGTAHSAGALFVLLADGVVKNGAQTAWLMGDLEHRAVSYGTSSEDADVVDTTYVGRSQIEWSPASADASYDGTYVYVENIVPRHRFGTEINPVASANFVGYRVTLTGTGGTVTADISTGNSAHVASAPMTTVTGVSVAALNKLTGPGDALALGVPATVPPGTNTPVAVINAGGAA